MSRTISSATTSEVFMLRRAGISFGRTGVEMFAWAARRGTAGFEVLLRGMVALGVVVIGAFKPSCWPPVASAAAGNTSKSRLVVASALRSHDFIASLQVDKFIIMITMISQNTGAGNG